jgi:iron complex outermembrane receptor protein
LGPTQSANPTFVSYVTWARNLGLSAIADPARLENTDNAQQQITERQYAITSLVTWQLGAITLDAVTGWRDWRYEPHIDGDYSSADVIRDNGAANLDRQFSEEFRLAGAVSTIHYVMGGYFFSRDLLGGGYTRYGSQYSQGLGAVGNAALNSGMTQSYTDVSNRNYAAFLQATWHIAPAWNLTAGGAGNLPSGIRHDRAQRLYWRKRPAAADRCRI